MVLLPEDLDRLTGGTALTPGAPAPVFLPNDLDEAVKNIRATSDIKSQQAIQAIKASRDTGLSTNVTLADPQSVQLRQMEHGMRAALADAPKTASLLAGEPVRAAAAKEDYESLSLLERLLQGGNPMIDNEFNFAEDTGFGGSFASTAKQTVRALPSLAKSTNEVLGIAAGALDSAERGLGGVLGTGSTGVFGSARDWLISQSEWINQNILQDPSLMLPKDKQGQLLEHEGGWNYRWANPQLLADPEWLSYNAGEVASSMAPMLAGTYFSGGSTLVGAAIGSGQEAGDLYRELITEGADPDRALTASTLFGVGVGWLNKIGLDKMLDKTATATLFKRAAKSLVAGTVEGITEYLEEPLQAALQGWAEQKNFPEIANDVQAALANIDVIPGSILFGGGVSYTQHYKHEYQRAKFSEGEQKFLDQIDQAAAAPQMAQHDPLLYQETLRVLKDGGKVTHVYIPAQALGTMYSGEGLAKVVDSLGVREQYEDEAAVGGDLKVDIGDYIKTVAADPNFAPTIANDRRLTPDGFTRNELADFQKRQAEEYKAVLDVVKADQQAESALEAEGQQIYKQVVEMRRASGMVSVSTTSDAAQMAAFFTTMAKRSDGQFTPRQLFEKYGPAEVRGMGQQDGQTLNQDSPALAGADFNDPAQVADAQKQWAEKGVESPYFKEWFGESKVVDAQGKPLVVYHWTDSVFESFSRTSDIGYHFGTKDAAKDRGAKVGGASVGIEPDAPSAADEATAKAVDGKIGGNPVDDLYALLLRKLDSPRTDLRTILADMSTAELEKTKDEYLEKPDSKNLADRVARGRRGKSFNVVVNGEIVSSHKSQREARARADKLARDAATPMAVYLSINNPIRLPDLGVWPAQEIAKESGFSTSEMASVAEAGSQQEQYAKVREILSTRGHDGIVYTNEVEDTGSDSYIAFSPTQIKSVFNRGTFDGDDARILHQFVGERAATADLGALARAKQLATRGFAPEDIWRETGWGLAPDGKWRFEIDDSGAEIERTTDVNGLDRLIKHPDLFKAYPELAHLRTEITELIGAKGEFSQVGASADSRQIRLSEQLLPAGRKPLSSESLLQMAENLRRFLEENPEGNQYNPREVTEAKIAQYEEAAKTAPTAGEKWNAEGLSTTLHEIQHAIQAIEGFAEGGSPSLISQLAHEIPNVKEYIDGLVAARMTAEGMDEHPSVGRPSLADYAKAKGYKRPTEKLKRMYAEEFRLDEYLNRSIAIKDEILREQYFDLHGETEARATQDRMSLTPEKRRAAFPDFFKRGDLIIKRGDEVYGRFVSEGDAVFYQPSLGFFSPTAKFVEAIQVKKPQPAKFWIDQLYKGKDPKPGLRPEELEDLGLREWLEGQQGVVSKEQVLQFIADGGPKLEEVRKGAEGEGPAMVDQDEEDGSWQVFMSDTEEVVAGFDMEDDARAEAERINSARGGTKFGQYQLPGGENYREVLVTVPPESRGFRIEETKSGYFVLTNPEGRTVGKPYEFEDEAKEALKFYEDQGRGDSVFKSSHWSEPNVLAHYRLNDRTDADGKRVLFIEEIQSDWHQAGRKKGYASEEAKAAWSAYKLEMRDKYTLGANDKRMTPEDKARGEKIRAAAIATTPNAPFKKSWPMLAFKRVLREAVEKGYDSVAWTTGDMQFDRWGSEEIAWKKQYSLYTTWREQYVVENSRSRNRGMVRGSMASAEKELASYPEGIRKDLRIITVKGEQKLLKKFDSLADAEGHRKSFYGDDASVELVPEWIVAATEQRGGDAGGVNIEEEARARGELLETSGQVVTSKEDLQKIAERVLSRESNTDQITKVVDRTWERMQAEDEGASMPRREGMKGFYDKMLPKMVQDYVKKLDPSAKVGVTGIKTGNTGDELFEIVLPNGKVVGQYESEKRAKALAETFDGAVVRNAGVVTPVHSLDITPTMREAIGQNGQALYQPLASDVNMGAVTFSTPSGKPIIDLFTKANASTFLHESGHIYFEAIKQMAAAPDAPPQIKEIWAAAKAGLYKLADSAATRAGQRTDLAPITGDDVRALLDADLKGATPQNRAAYIGLQEEWARQIEAYFMEGKTPNLELRSVFQKFKDWLRAIYENFSKLGMAEPSEELKPIFDRIFATDQQIAEAEGFYLATKPFIDQGFELADADRAAYLARVNKAKETASDARMRKLASAYVQALGGKDAFTKAATEEINAMPVYQAMDEIIAEGGFDRQAVIDLIGKDAAAALSKRRRGLVSKDGKEPILRPGFNSLAEMLNAMLSSPTKKEAIKNLTETKLAQERKTLERLVQDDKVLPGDEDYHNDDRLAVLHAEFILLSKQMKGRDLAARMRDAQLEVAAVREAARQAIAGMITSTAVSPSKFARQERKAAKDAFAAKLKGDLPAMAEAKRKELLNHALFMESVAASETLAKLERRVKRMTNSKSIRKDSREVAERVGIQFGLLKPTKQRTASAEWNAYKARLDADEKTPPTLAEWALAKSELDYDVNFDPFVLTTQEPLNYKKLTWGQVLAIREALNIIRVIDKDERTILLNGQRIDLEELLAKLADGLDPELAKEKPGAKPGSPYIKKRGLKDLLKGVHANHMKIEALVMRLDGWKPGGIWWDAIFRPVAGAENASSLRLKTVAADLKEMFSLYAKKKDDLFNKQILIPAIGQSMTKSQLLAVALNLGNEGNLTRLAKGENWLVGESPDMAKIMAVLSPLQKEDWDFVQRVWDYLDTFRPEAFDLEERMTGKRPERVEPKAIQTPFGVYRGGYYPAVYDADRSYTTFSRKQAEDDKTLFGRNYGSSQTKHNHLKARAQNGGDQKLSLDLAVLSEHLFTVVHDITHREPLIQVAKLVRNKEVTRMIEDALGKEAYREFWPWLQDVARERMTPPFTKVERMARWARKGTTMMSMGLKMTTMLTQPFGITQTFDYLGAGYTMAGVKAVYKNLPDMYRTITEKSPFMANRLNSYDRDVRDSMKGFGAFGDFQKDVERFAYYGIGMMQMGVDLPTWWGGYLKGLKEFNGDEPKAVAYADAAVRMSQGSGNTKDLSKVQRGPELQRLFTMFYSYFNVLYNLSYRAGTRFKGDRNIPRAAASALLLWFLPAVLTEIATGRGPDEDDEWPSWLVQKLALYPLNMIVGVRDLANAIGTEYGYKVTPAASAPEALVKWAKAVTKAVEDEEPEKLVKPTIEMIGFAAHLPLKQVEITVGNVWDYMTGEDPEFQLRDLLYTKQKSRR